MADAAGVGWMHSTLMPTIISVVVIVAVNFLSEYGTLAAAIATAPTGTPLSLWVMVQQNPHRKAAVLREYTWALIKGVAATLAFAIGAHAAARQGAGLWIVLTAGYVAWLVAWASLQIVL